jgi:adenylylsulfate kinase-like enzyme
MPLVILDLFDSNKNATMVHSSLLFVVVGKPASGKGAIASMLASTLSLKLLSPDNVNHMGHLATDALVPWKKD